MWYVMWNLKMSVNYELKSIGKEVVVVYYAISCLHELNKPQSECHVLGTRMETATT
jgi:hypothetical protein